MIRRLQPDDGEVVKSLRLAALADAPGAFGSTHEAASRRSDENWAALLAPDANPTFVWEIDGQALGMVVAIPDQDEDVVHLAAMWVAPAARGSGAAGALVARVLDWAAERSAALVRLRVVEQNTAALRLYERHGFHRTGATQTCERDGETEIEMEHPLNRT